MVRSHVKVPAVYLKQFRVKQGVHPSNRDPIYVYDKKTTSFDFKKNSRGKWVETIDFYSQEIEKFNQIFEDEYNQSYKEICNSFKMGTEIRKKTRNWMVKIIGNLRAREISTVYFDIQEEISISKRNDIVPIMTEHVSSKYSSEIEFLKIPIGELMTSDTPLLTITPSYLRDSFASIRVLALDFDHMVFLIQWRYAEEEEQLKKMCSAWKEDPDRFITWFCCEQVLKAQRYIIFRHQEYFNQILNMEYVQERIKRL